MNKNGTDVQPADGLDIQQTKLEHRTDMQGPAVASQPSGQDAANLDGGRDAANDNQSGNNTLNQNNGNPTAEQRIGKEDVSVFFLSKLLDLQEANARKQDEMLSVLRDVASYMGPPAKSNFRSDNRDEERKEEKEREKKNIGNQNFTVLSPNARNQESGSNGSSRAIRWGDMDNDEEVVANVATPGKFVVQNASDQNRRGMDCGISAAPNGRISLLLKTAERSTTLEEIITQETLPQGHAEAIAIDGNGKAKGTKIWYATSMRDTIVLTNDPVTEVKGHKRRELYTWTKLEREGMCAEAAWKEYADRPKRIIMVERTDAAWYIFDAEIMEMIHAKPNTLGTRPKCGLCLEAGCTSTLGRPCPNAAFKPNEFPSSQESLTLVPATRPWWQSESSMKGVPDDMWNAVEHRCLSVHIIVTGTNKEIVRSGIANEIRRTNPQGRIVVAGILVQVDVGEGHPDNNGAVQVQIHRGTLAEAMAIPGPNPVILWEQGDAVMNMSEQLRASGKRKIAAIFQSNTDAWSRNDLLRTTILQAVLCARERGQECWAIGRDEEANGEKGTIPCDLHVLRFGEDEAPAHATLKRLTTSLGNYQRLQVVTTTISKVNTNQDVIDEILGNESMKEDNHVTAIIVSATDLNRMTAAIQLVGQRRVELHHRNVLGSGPMLLFAINDAGDLRLSQEERKRRDKYHTLAAYQLLRSTRIGLEAVAARVLERSRAKDPPLKDGDKLMNTVFLVHSDGGTDGVERETLLKIIDGGKRISLHYMDGIIPARNINTSIVDEQKVRPLNNVIIASDGSNREDLANAVSRIQLPTSIILIGLKSTQRQEEFTRWATRVMPPECRWTIHGDDDSPTSVIRLMVMEARLIQSRPQGNMMESKEESSGPKAGKSEQPKNPRITGKQGTSDQERDPSPTPMKPDRERANAERPVEGKGKEEDPPKRIKTRTEKISEPPSIVIRLLHQGEDADWTNPGRRRVSMEREQVESFNVKGLVRHLTLLLDVSKKPEVLWRANGKWTRMDKKDYDQRATNLVVVDPDKVPTITLRESQSKKKSKNKSKWSTPAPKFKTPKVANTDGKKKATPSDTFKGVTQRTTRDSKYVTDEKTQKAINQYVSIMVKKLNYPNSHEEESYAKAINDMIREFIADQLNSTTILGTLNEYELILTLVRLLPNDQTARDVRESWTTKVNRSVENGERITLRDCITDIVERLTGMTAMRIRQQFDKTFQKKDEKPEDFLARITTLSQAYGTLDDHTSKHAATRITLGMNEETIRDLNQYNRAFPKFVRQITQHKLPLDEAIERVKVILSETNQYMNALRLHNVGRYKHEQQQRQLRFDRRQQFNAQGIRNVRNEGEDDGDWDPFVEDKLYVRGSDDEGETIEEKLKNLEDEEAGLYHIRIHNVSVPVEAVEGARKLLCYNCGEPGHYASSCESEDTNMKFAPEHIKEKLVKHLKRGANQRLTVDHPEAKERGRFLMHGANVSEKGRKGAGQKINERKVATTAIRKILQIPDPDTNRFL